MKGFCVSILADTGEETVFKHCGQLLELLFLSYYFYENYFQALDRRRTRKRWGRKGEKIEGKREKING